MREKWAVDIAENLHPGQVCTNCEEILDEVILIFENIHKEYTVKWSDNNFYHIPPGSLRKTTKVIGIQCPECGIIYEINPVYVTPHDFLSVTI